MSVQWPLRLLASALFHVLGMGRAMLPPCASPGVMVASCGAKLGIGARGNEKGARRYYDNGASEPQYATIARKRISGRKSVAALHRLLRQGLCLLFVLGLGHGLEKGAASAYLGALPNFHNKDLTRAAGSILGDETMHWAILLNTLGEDPVPGAFIG